MGRLFILIKRKGSRRFLGVIPAKPGATKTTLRRQLARKIQKGFSFKIVNIAQLKTVIKRQKPRGARIRRMKGKRTVRRKKTRKKTKQKRRKQSSSIW